MKMNEMASYDTEKISVKSAAWFDCFNIQFQYFVSIDDEWERKVSSCGFGWYCEIWSVFVLINFDFNNIFPL